MKSNENYYDEIADRFRNVSGKKAKEIYFTGTEPPDWGQPHHQKVLHLNKAKSIATLMLTRLTTDILRNSMTGWMALTPLPGRNDSNQPLGDCNDWP